LDVRKEQVEGIASTRGEASWRKMLIVQRRVHNFVYKRDRGCGIKMRTESCSNVKKGLTWEPCETWCERYLEPRIGLLWDTVQVAQELDSEEDSEENGQEGEDTGQGIGGLEPKDDMSLVFGTFVYLLPTRRYLVDEMPGLREVLSMQHSSTAAEKAQ
jgi:hypothetical protein